jgi:predicted deacetylase
VAARLIVSLTADEDVAGLEPFADALAARRVPLSLLVRPVGPEGPLAPRSRRAGWLRERQSGGDALVPHGYDHSRRPLGPQHRIRRAEFSALPAHEATLRLAAARWVTERAGLELVAFAPPDWRASVGTLTALAARGFAVCGDAVGVHLFTGPTRCSHVHGCSVSRAVLACPRPCPPRCWSPERPDRPQGRGGPDRGVRRRPPPTRASRRRAPCGRPGARTRGNGRDLCVDRGCRARSLRKVSTRAGKGVDSRRQRCRLAAANGSCRATA